MFMDDEKMPASSSDDADDEKMDEAESETSDEETV